MRRFVDLHLCQSTNDLDKLEKMVTRSFALGYRLVGIPFQPDVKKGEMSRVRDICRSANVDLVTRVDLVPKTPRELLNSLRLFRRKVEVISVTCISKSVARQAAKDNRVDVLSFLAAVPRKRFFDRAEAELASKGSAFLEIDMSSLLLLEGISRIRLVSSLQKEVAIAKKFRIPIVISSGATNEYYLRHPYDYASLTTLFHMTPSFALDALSEVPLSIVKRNRQKLSLDYIAEGVRLIRRRE